jgi:hypothetical protein
MRTKAIVPKSGLALSGVLQGLLLLAGAQVALAAPPAVTHEGGLLKLKNVRIEAASPAQALEASRTNPVAGQAGLRAFIDPVTGQLREQGSEEMIDQAKAAPAPVAAKSTFTTSFGAVGVMLDESYMSNAVVTKDASGKARLQCVTGAEAAQSQVLKGQAGKAHNHDH